MEEKQKTRAELREERKAQLAIDEKAQYDVDIEAIDAFEIELGDSNVGILRVPYTPGLPVLVAVRTPHELEVKRYRARVKDREDAAAAVAGAIELGDACRLYPDQETFSKLVKARPNLPIDCGTRAIRMAVASANAEGKD